MAYYYNGSHDIYERFHSQVKKKSQSGGSCRVEQIDSLAYYYNGNHDIYEWFHSQVKKKSQSGGSWRVEQR